MQAHTKDHGSRDLPGPYGRHLPDPKWPNGAHLALSFVVNYEEGGEHTLLNGDAHSEAFLTENGATGTTRPSRTLGVESAYEYGSHRGFWRILDLFEKQGLSFTCWAIGRAVELNPQVVDAMQSAGCEVASHSYRWIDYNDVPEAEERSHVHKTIDVISQASKSSTPPLGWYTGRQSLQTRRIVYETYRERGLADQLYDNDAYDEDLPYWVPCPSPAVAANASAQESDAPLLVLPYTLDTNDMKFAQTPGFATSEHFFTYLRDAFDVLYEEGKSGSPRMMTVGLHCRVIGRPGRFAGLLRFIEYVKKKERVWITTRRDIAAHWRTNHPPPSLPTSDA
ncbi:chitin deacetylase Cda1 [Ceraceosorus guamensis]|uniref:Chitin deacetylase Cda1 n=1 Tax=Ceraceosorus guamensis TaxID=1522189 RepID=A0A316WA00_9BASI|nr:chitin deacetylase Cda1 [Ceraceosorus guamensis]PWN44475.1 chitin deacetylase Cda1 [Ceraceosorus guamensis]